MACYLLFSCHQVQNNHLQMNAFLEQILWQIWAEIGIHFVTIQTRCYVSYWNGAETAVVHVVKISILLPRYSSPAEKQRVIVLPVALGLQMLSLQSAWPILQISRRSNKICKLPFKSMLNPAIYIACAAVIIGWCPHRDIKLYANAFISLVCCLTRLTIFSVIFCLETSTFLSAAPLLVFKSLLTTIWWSDSSGDAPCNCCSSFI